MNTTLPTLRHPFPDLDRFINDFFFDTSTMAKPPYDISPVPDPENGNLVAWEIQMALAGFSNKDIKVWHEGRKLCVKGDNSENNISNKFTSSFEHVFIAKDNVDLTSADISFTNGMLSIKLPVIKPKDKQYLYGNE